MDLEVRVDSLDIIEYGEDLSRGIVDVKLSERSVLPRIIVAVGCMQNGHINADRDFMRFNMYSYQSQRSLRHPRVREYNLSRHLRCRQWLY